VTARQYGAAYEVDYRIIRPDGTVRQIRDRAVPIRDESGTVCQIAGIARDVTDMQK
jgi:PAS domain S-box-containing protein